MKEKAKADPNATKPKKYIVPRKEKRKKKEKN
jgi:hypothetical protein